MRSMCSMVFNQIQYAGLCTLGLTSGSGSETLCPSRPKYLPGSNGYAVGTMVKISACGKTPAVKPRRWSVMCLGEISPSVALSMQPVGAGSMMGSQAIFAPDSFMRTIAILSKALLLVRT